MYTRYLLWLSDAVRGDLGRSAIQGQDVSTAITNAIPVTLQLMLYAQLARPAHRRAGRGLRGVPGEPPRRPRRQHGARSPRLSIPNFVLAILLVLFLALGGFKIGPVTVGGSLFPASRYEAFGEGPVEHFKHMALPTIALALGLAATYMRVLRSDMISHAAGELHHHGQGQGRVRPADPVGPRPAAVVVHAAHRVRHQHRRR